MPALTAGSPNSSQAAAGSAVVEQRRGEEPGERKNAVQSAAHRIVLIFQIGRENRNSTRGTGVGRRFHLRHGGQQSLGVAQVAPAGRQRRPSALLLDGQPIIRLGVIDRRREPLREIVARLVVLLVGWAFLSSRFLSLLPSGRNAQPTAASVAARAATGRHRAATIARRGQFMGRGVRS